MSCGRRPGEQGWSGYAGGSGSSGWAGSTQLPGVSGFAADLSAWTRSSRLRVGDAERDAAVEALGEHFAAGRLTHEEFDERSTAAWSARTAGELAALFTDLPRTQTATAAATARAFSRRPPRPRFPLLPVLALSLAVALLTPVPFLVVLLLAWVGFTLMVRPALVRHHATALHRGHTSGSRRAARGTWS